MDREEKVPFLHMFPFCQEDELGVRMTGAFVTKALASREKLTLSLTLEMDTPVREDQLKILEGRIADTMGLRDVAISLKPGDKPSAAPEKSAGKAASGGKTASDGKAKPEQKGKLIYGKAMKRNITPMSELSAESGAVALRGEIFSVDSKAVRNDGWVLSFEMTDNTGSVRVTKYFRQKEDRGQLASLKKGMYVTVYGDIILDRYDQDIVLSPKGIVELKKPQREDLAEEKRVELHLHTRFSALDALTDPAQAVKRAAAWGHKAIAVTDHGVCHSFPDVWKAGKGAGIKVIYGLEGYYINDLDDREALTGPGSGSISGDYVAFDLETTGLRAERERITEIGAVLFKDGKAVEQFQTFVDPGMPISPEVTRLTGITDSDVKGAPDEGSALKAFLDFAGDRPLVAHNAEFDLSFLAAAGERNSINFEPVCLDTLVLAQLLLPDMKRHKLNLVADRLGLPDFNHHRAVDDARTCGMIMAVFAEMLKSRGTERLEELRELSAKRSGELGKRGRARHIVLLVKNKTGLKNLYELVSRSHLEYFNKYPIIPKSLLMRCREGLIIGSACEAGEVFDAVVRHRGQRTLERIASFYDYLEIQPVCNNAFMLDNGSARNEEDLRDFNRRIVELGKKLGKPVVATGDVHFLDPHQEIFRRILLAGKQFADADRPMPLYFKTTDEMLREFAYLGEEDCRRVVVEAPNAIAEMCQEIELLPKGLYAPKIENSVEDLQDLVYGRMHELYGDDPPRAVTERVEAELNDIINCHYDVIYMSAQKLVSKSLEAGYLVGSRGSVGSSVVAYMAGITEVNALPPHYRCPNCQYSDFENGKDYGCGADMLDKDCPNCQTKMKKDGFDIPFETFLGFGGDKVPDIDLNFSGEYQARAHKYTEELFGRDHVFKAGTIGTLAEKTAYGYVKKYLEERSMIVTKAEENRLAQGCVGVKRTTGQHPGGLVIIPQDMDVTDFCPVQRPADDPDSGIITTHFDYHCMEDNLLKLDELGHDDPTMIKMLEDLTGENAREIPLDDPDTMSIFKSPAVLGLPEDDPIIGKTGTIGIPEFGTAFTRQMLVDTRPEDFDTLVRLSGFSHGTDVWAGNIRELILSGTATVRQTVGCRDDIMLYLIKMGMEPKRAFKFMEAVRKGAIHKGKPWPEGIEEEMHTLGVPDWYIESCRKIQYLFPKAHAVAYVMMAFRIAWFKVHYPLEYYSCYFYRRKNSFDAEAMAMGIDKVQRKIREIKANPQATAKDEDSLTTLEAVYEFYMRGFTFAPIDIYRSHATEFVIDGNSLIPPFVAVAGLGEAAAADLMECRKNGRRFISAEELARACPKVSKTHMEQLRELGALGDLPETSQMSLF